MLAKNELHRDALGSVINQSQNADGESYTVLANGDVSDIDFHHTMLLRDAHGDPLPEQYYDVLSKKFVPGKIPVDNTDILNTITMLGNMVSTQLSEIRRDFDIRLDHIQDIYGTKVRDILPGETNDNLRLSDAIDRCILNGSHFVVIKEHHQLTSALIVPSNVSLVGRKSSGSLNFLIDGTDHGVVVRGDNVEILVDINVEINGNGAIGHAGLGNNILIGDYQSDTFQEYQNIEISGRMTRTGPGLNNTATIGIFNKCHNIRIKDTVITQGGNGIGMHWSGDFPTSDPHFGNANVTWHPYDIEIENVTFMNCNYDLFLSAVYDVNIVNVKSINSQNGMYSAAGDFGNRLATASQRNLIGTGINVDGMNVSNCINNAIELQAVGARNGVPTMNNNYNVSLKNIVVESGAATLINRTALLIRQIRNVNVSNLNVIGYTRTGQSAIYIYDAEMIKVEKFKSISEVGCTVLSSKSVSINGIINGPSTNTSSGVTIRGEMLNNTLSGILNTGATSLTLTTPIDRALYEGNRMVFGNGTFVTVSAYTPLDSTTVPINTSTISMPAGSSLSVTKYCEFINVSSEIRSFNNGIVVERFSRNITVSDSILERNLRNDVSSITTDVSNFNIIRSAFLNSGMSTSFNTFNIVTGSSGGTITDNYFDSVNDQFNINLLAASNNNIVTHNTSGGVRANGAVIFQGTQTAATLAIGRNIFNDNRTNVPATLISGTGWTTTQITISGPTSARPTNVPVGYQFRDTTLSKTVTWSGTQWIDTDGRFVNVPATSTSAGIRGDFSADANYIYICYSTNLWNRVVKDTTFI